MDLLRTPIGEGMSGSRSQPQPVCFSQWRHLAANLFNFLFGFFDVLADARSHFDHRLMHLRLDPFFHKAVAFLDYLGLDVGAQVTADRIDGLILFFNAYGEAGLHGSPFCQWLMLTCVGSDETRYVKRDA